jgi:hypothetical protein
VFRAYRLLLQATTSTSHSHAQATTSHGIQTQTATPLHQTSLCACESGVCLYAHFYDRDSKYLLFEILIGLYREDAAGKNLFVPKRHAHTNHARV